MEDGVVRDLETIFRQVEDPRLEGTKRHRLGDTPFYRPPYAQTLALSNEINRTMYYLSDYCPSLDIAQN